MIHVLFNFICADEGRNIFRRLQHVASKPSPTEPAHSNYFVRCDRYGNRMHGKLVICKELLPMAIQFLIVHDGPLTGPTPRAL
jgi:hypothetical protein